MRRDARSRLQEQMLLLLLACQTPSSSCDTLPAPMPVAACIGPSDGGGTMQVLYSGDFVVEEVGSGDFPADCDGRVGEDDGRGQWLRLSQSEGPAIVVGYTLSTAPLSVAVGDTLDVYAAYEFGGFAATLATLQLRDALGSLIVWVGQGGTEDQLLPPEETKIARGPQICEEQSECGRVGSFDLRVEMASRTAELPYGDSATIDGYIFQHAGNTQGLDSTGGCLDWFVSDLRVGIGRE